MDLNQFTFTFQLPSVHNPFPTSPTPMPTRPPAIKITPSSADGLDILTGSTHAAAQARYRAKNADAEREKARERMHKLRHRKIAGSSTDNLKHLSSEQLRATKTFAAFRDYVREFMFWIVVDDNNPRALAAYDRFISNNTPSQTNKLSDNDLEFLYRHVTPEPQSIEDWD